MTTTSISALLREAADRLADAADEVDRQSRLVDSVTEQLQQLRDRDQDAATDPQGRDVAALDRVVRRVPANAENAASLRDGDRGSVPDVAEVHQGSIADGLMTVEEFSALLRMPVSTARYWRQISKGPPGIKVGKRVLYSQSEVVAWIERQAALAHCQAIPGEHGDCPAEVHWAKCHGSVL